jgi:hypothetical protein
MIANAFKINVLPVKQKALLGIEFDRTDAKSGFVTINNLSVG